jgi:hypothetical protein
MTPSRPVGQPASRQSSRHADVHGPVSIVAATAAPATARRGGKREKLSKDLYRRRKASIDADLSRLGLRKSQLELAMSTPGIAANFVEMRRVASELADVEQALATVEDAWLELEERAP